MTTYAVHDNGGRPFHVLVEGNTATVLKADTNHSYTPWMTFDCETIFVGQGDGTDWELGNSVLLQEHDGWYVWVGWMVLRFRLHEGATRFVRFESPVGNSDVPYPYAFTDDGYVYFFLEEERMEFNDADAFDYRRYYSIRANAQPLCDLTVLHDRHFY